MYRLAPATLHLLLAVYYSLLAANYSLLAVHYSLLIAVLEREAASHERDCELAAKLGLQQDVLTLADQVFLDSPPRAVYSEWCV